MKGREKENERERERKIVKGKRRKDSSIQKDKSRDWS
jgi:hypothetical protein